MARSIAAAESRRKRAWSERVTGYPSLANRARGFESARMT
jgi:hypothetical protein